MSPTVQAALNLDSAIDEERQLPSNVFRGIWDAVFFFDSDDLFQPDSIKLFASLMTAEGSSCVFVRNFDISRDKHDHQRECFVFDGTVGLDDYTSVLNGVGGSPGWVIRVDTFGFISDVGRWCIYCERFNELAVIATQDPQMTQTLGQVLEDLKAFPVPQAVITPTCWGMRGLRPEFREKLLRAYAPRAKEERQ